MGLRERKKAATREAIQRAALALFLAKGYDQTTTEEIADAAMVSPSTLFNYFPSKEDLVLADEFDPLFIPLLESRPPDEPIFTAFRRAFSAGLAAFGDADQDFIRARARLVREVPALRAAALLDRERSAVLLRGILARRYQRKSDDFEIKVVSAVIVSAMVTAMEHWLESDRKTDVLELVGRALDVAESGPRFTAPPKTRRKK